MGKAGPAGREQKGQGAREQLLDSALDLFNTHGSADVTTNQIAEAAGRSPGNLYYHFRDREALVRCLFERLVARWAEVYALPEGRAPTLADLEAMLSGNFEALWEFRFIYRDLSTLLGRDPAFREAYAAARKAGFANFRSLLSHYVQAGILVAPANDDDAEQLANLLWLIGDYWLPFLEAGDGQVTKARIHDGIALFRRVLKPYIRTEPK